MQSPSAPPSASGTSRCFSESSSSRPPQDTKRRKLRIAIVTENFLPKVDGVTRTLARLLEHLRAEGHDALVCGPENGLSEYAGFPVIGTFGVPLLVYPGLKLNFARPRFINELTRFRPDVVHFVDPIWLGAQMLPLVNHYLPLVPCVSSYHTNLPTYATLFGAPWLESIMWNLTRRLHARCEIVFCPSESTRRMLRGKGFENVEIWSRGVDTNLFNPSARDDNLRASWGCTPKPARLTGPLTPSVVPVDSKAKLLQYARKLSLRPSKKRRARGASISADLDDVFIRTPPSEPTEFSPPPSYDSLNDVPELPLSPFSLPPPAISPTECVVSQPPITAEEPESKTVILYVGRLSWEKNLHLLVEAFRLLPAPVRAASKLVFVGDGPARAELTGLCKRLKLDATFMGHQKGSRLAALYASASFFAFPSFTETFGQVVLEALASGLPVVGLNAEGTSDLVVHGKTGLLLDVAAVTRPGKHTEAGEVPPIPSVGEFAAVMTPTHPAFQQCAREYSALFERLVCDRTLRATMGQRAQVGAVCRTWYNAMDAVVQGYEDVSKRAGVARLNDEHMNEALLQLHARQFKPLG
ncbi:hypothetical protein K488DRAFT_63603 [Vararia minispora EC-137]|uniref:Uncharacterized protein n=1 Tax=Vararia minispora EC-137 TaxID=1314806 RepID=A0ACB8Q666_9AGAM|nr:hypothetical protein K488DRAFT_63603 [Vararia minispora EC-137]